MTLLHWHLLKFDKPYISMLCRHSWPNIFLHIITLRSAWCFPPHVYSDQWSVQIASVSLDNQLDVFQSQQCSFICLNRIWHSLLRSGLLLLKKLTIYLLSDLRRMTLTPPSHDATRPPLSFCAASSELCLISSRRRQVTILVSWYS